MFSSARPVVVALAATLLIASCGSDDTANTSTDTVADTTVVESTVVETTVGTTPGTTETTVESTTATTEASTQDIDADIAASQTALLTLADFPDGWTEAPPAGDAAAAIDVSLAECLGADSLTSSDTQSMSSMFTSADGNYIVSERVGLQATEQDARIVLAGVTNPDVPACFAAAYTTVGAAASSAGAIPEGAEIGEVTASRLAVGSAGDATQAIRVVIPFTSADGATQITVDHVLIRSGRSLAALTFEARVEPTAVEAIDAITTAAASHLPV